MSPSRRPAGRRTPRINRPSVLALEGRTLLTGSRRVSLDADDFVFLRPTESEGVLTQFGDIAVFDGEAINAWWPAFQPAG